VILLFNRFMASTISDGYTQIRRYAHAFLNAFRFKAEIVFLTRRRLLGYCAHVQGAKYKKEKEVKNFHRWQIKGLRVTKVVPSASVLRKGSLL
jgi:hypothetical protein